jgi:hypothetical protein
LWDIRARGSVYELATGNNAVVDMVWDSERNVLYAATECKYIDRLGSHYDYRTAKLPKWQKAAEARETPATDEYGNDIDMDESEDKSEGDDEDDEDDDEERCWPEHAHHIEGYFGYMFDAGDHTLCEIWPSFSPCHIADQSYLVRYSFKESPDKILPAYGSATTRSDYW